MIGLGLLLLQATGSVSGVVVMRSVASREAVVTLSPVDPTGRPEPSLDTVAIDQRDLAFLPRTLIVAVGTTVAFRNSDPILHNVFSPLGPDGGFDLGTYPRGASRTHRFMRPGEWVVLCHVHPEMVAFVETIETRWHAVTDPAGRFSISDLPAGRYRLGAWLPRSARTEREIDIVGGRVTEVEVELPTGRRRGGAW